MPALSWPNDAKLALSLVVNVEEGAEARVDEGDKRPEPVDELGITLKAPIRNYGNESNYQYGLKAGAPRVMKLLEERELKATFTAAAVSLERAPDLARRIVAGGHEVCAHGWRWVHQFHMDEAAERDLIRAGAEAVAPSLPEPPLRRSLSGGLFMHEDKTIFVRRNFLWKGHSVDS